MNRWVKCAVSLGLSALGVYFLFSYGSHTFHLDVDFNMRYNEVCSVLSGRDPFLIWKGTLPSGEFVPYASRHLPLWHSLQLIHAYSPWGYVFMMPFVLMERMSAANCYRILEFLLLFGMLAGGTVALRRRTGVWWVAALGFALMVGVASDGFERCLVVGNFGIVVTAAAFLALWMNERGYDGFAGLFWAIVMVKPQLGGLFLLTLVLERKWRTLLTVALVLGVATVIPAILCKRSPVEMVLAVGECGIGQFPGTGLISAAHYYRLAASYGERILLASNALVGIAACCAFWAILRKNTSVWTRFVPAMVLSLTWATCRLHDFSIQMLAAFAIILAMGSRPSRTDAISAALLSGALVLRGYAFYEGPFIVPANLLVLVATYVFARAQSASTSSRDTSLPC